MLNFTIFFKALKDIENINNKKLEITTRGPNSKSVILKIKDPKITATTPKIEDKVLKDLKFLETFIAAAAGKTVKPATNNPPTNFTPRAAIAEIERM
jgi:hypothetical protein